MTRRMTAGISPAMFFAPLLAATAAWGQGPPAISGPAAARGPATGPPAVGPAATRGSTGGPAASGAAAVPGPVAARTAATPKDLKYPPLRPIRAPGVQGVTLPNGLRLFLLEDHELPVINGLAMIRTGNLFDPPDKIGLAGMTGMLMRTGGAQNRTGEEINRQLENLAAAVESGIGETSGSVSFSAVRESAGAVLEIFRDVLTAPEFRQDQIDLRKSQIAGAISRRNDDAARVTQREFTDILYGKDTPYGWQEQYDTIQRISRADLRDFHKRFYFPKNVLLAVWGDFDSAAMKSQIARLFADWTVEQPPVPAFPKIQEAPAPGIYLASKKDTGDSLFALGHLSGEIKDKDYPALEIMTEILGGAYHGRLADRLRTRAVNVSGIRAQWAANYDHPGLFEISGSLNATATVDALRWIREELERMRAAEVTEDELRTAKDALINRLAFASDTSDKTMGRLLAYEYFGYPRDFLEQYQKGLTAVTRGDVLRVAKQHLEPANLTIVVAGNPVMFGQPLSALSPFVNPLDLTIPDPKPAPLKGDEASLAQGRQILLRAQEAAGGTGRLSAVRDCTEVVEFRLTPENGGMKVAQTDRWIAPSTFRQDSVLPAGRISAYSDGRSGWISTPQGYGALGGAQLKQVQGDLFRLYFRLLLSDQIEGRTVNALDSSRVEISDATGQIATVEFDSKTGLPARVRYDLSQAAGAPVSVTDEYGDFREIGGVMVPHKIAITRGGLKFADVTVSDYKVNTGLEARELAKRP